jgi:hypothetical protein
MSARAINRIEREFGPFFLVYKLVRRAGALEKSRRGPVIGHDRGPGSVM